LERDIYRSLLVWKRSEGRKPLILRGARQVGKTWLMKEFGRREFERTAYFDFERTRELHSVFSKGFDIGRILSSLNILAGFEIRPETTLIVLDEIQACPDAITSLKYFREAVPSQAVVAAGSLLGVAMHRDFSFPVGNVDFMTLHPLGFSEFLRAVGDTASIQVLEKADPVLAETFHDTLVESLKRYLFIGGMPEAVSDFSVHRRFERVRDIQESILAAYENDFSKHAPASALPRIRMVWRSIVGQLAKENAKFVYSLMRTGARAKEFELALEWLKDAGLIHKVHRISKPGLPIQAYADWSDFKVYLNDTGLLCALGDIPAGVLLRDNDLFTEFKGRLTEQFVLQQLVCESVQPFYWSPDTGISEVDFVMQAGERVIPIEVKSALNLKSKSLRVYHDKYHPIRCIRTSLAGYQQQDWMENIPLYGFQDWLRRYPPTC
jgi:predicted AAA+ superfamily ATPase